MKMIEQLLREKAAIEEELKKYKQFRCIMFTDIKGSTAYFSKKGDLAGRTMVQKHNDMLFPIIEKCRGAVIKTIGDAIMAAFDNPENAVKSAVMMQIKLSEYNQNEPDPEEEIHIRIGIHAGVGFIDPHDVFGNVVNIAARVESLADGDQIYITETVYNKVKKELQQKCRSLGEQSLKGVEKPQHIYEVLWQQEKNVIENLSPIPFEVRVWTETGTKTSIRDIRVVPLGSTNTHSLGQTITINFSATRDCYLTLLNIGTSGKFTILFPNEYVPDNFIHAQQIYTFPGKDYPFEYKLTGPLGTEKIKAIATLKPVKLTEADFSPIGDLLIENIGDRLGDLRIENADVPYNATKDITISAKQNNPPRMREWTEDMCTFKVIN